MNDLMKVIKGRRSVRTYDGKGLRDEDVSKLESCMELSEVLKIALTKGLGKDDIRITLQT